MPTIAETDFQLSHYSSLCEVSRRKMLVPHFLGIVDVHLSGVQLFGTNMCAQNYSFLFWLLF